MPIRRVIQRSERGSIRNLGKEPEMIEKPSGLELRFKRLYEHAQRYHDHKLMAGLGVITTDYISDKNALPLSIYRLKKIVDDIKAKSSDKIDSLSQQFASYFSEPLSPLAMEYLSCRKARVKTAGVRKPVFWRASKR